MINEEHILCSEEPQLVNCECISHVLIKLKILLLVNENKRQNGFYSILVITNLNALQVLDIHDEIQAVLSEPVAPSTDADLEKELAALLLDNLPNPPNDSPKKEQIDIKISGIVTIICQTHNSSKRNQINIKILCILIILKFEPHVRQEAN